MSMNLPKLKYSGGIRKAQQIRFGGMNHTVGAQDGSLWDMENLWSEHSPVLSTRGKRYRLRKLERPGGLFAYRKLAWVDGTKFYYDGQERGVVTAGKKSFAALGVYIVILPDKCYYNTNTGQFGSLEAGWAGNSLTFCNGTLFEEGADANTIKCEGVDWSQYFRKGDAVTIAGCTVQSGNNQTVIIREIQGDELRFYEFSFTLGDGESYEETGSLSVRRTVPDILWCCENENRLWGCTRDTIYATKQGDIFNWNVYDGLESDAYAVTPGSAGAFTGCVSYRGFPVFFKEEKIYKVYGSIPSNFEVVGSATLGLADGSDGSLAVAGETLLYLGRNGIAAYTGGIPQPVGAAFGAEHYKDACAGSDGLKYYVSMEDEQGAWSLYVYDTQRRLWHREDGTHATHFAYQDGNLYCLTDQGEILILGNVQDPPEGAEEEGDISWWAEFTDFTEGSPNKKGMSKLQLRVKLEQDARMEVLVQFDSDGQWRTVDTLWGEDPKRSYYLPIIPRRCDHYRLKLQGTGACQVHSLVREIYSGSEMKSRYGRN